jgi:UDP-glucose 4-epimerase
MRDAGIPRLIFTSSGAVYGEQVKQPVGETAPAYPRSPYAVSKLAAETYVHTIGDLWGATTIALRIFNAYGPGQPVLPSHSPVIPRFIHQALGGGSLVIFGSGEQTRDFIYIDDVVRAMIATLTADVGDQRTLNVGSGIETSIDELARQVLTLTHSQSNIIYSPVTGGGVSRLRADVSLAHTRLGFSPRVSLVDGLKETIAARPH